MNYPVDFKETIEKAFISYGTSVAQERSIADVRDGLKIGLRQGLYAQYTSGLTYKDKFQKAQKSVAAAMSQSYVHGDVSMYDTFIRAAKPWVYRYPLEAVQGAYGDPCAPDNHSAARYVEMKSGAIADYLFDGLKKEAITEWYDNYDDTEQIPTVFPSIGFWNIVNGCSGIAVGMVTSCPQYNIKEVNTALIKLIKNPTIDFDSIYCPPDFAQGGIIINADEVKKSIEKGSGAAIKIRAVIEYDSKANVLKITQMPYGIFTNTIIGQLKTLTEKDENYGIEKVVDYTKKDADIRIYLKKNVDAKLMINKLYKDTDLESSFPLNMLMLDNGRYPKIFGWREACDSYIAHCRLCQTNIIKYEKRIAEERLNILNGLIIAYDHIDNVINLIKSSEDAQKANEQLIKLYGLNEKQSQAILSLKLASLSKLDITKINDEKSNLDKMIISYQHILDTPSALDELIIKKLEAVIKSYGDNRRTQLCNLVKEEIDTTAVSPITLSILSNNFISIDTKIKLPKNTCIRTALTSSSDKKLLAFTNRGNLFSKELSVIKSGIICVKDLFPYMGANEQVVYITVSSESGSICFITKSGLVKKTPIAEYDIASQKGVIAIKLNENDEVVSVLPSLNRLFILASNNKYVCFNASEISDTGRATRGVVGIKLNDDEYVTVSCNTDESVVLVNSIDETTIEEITTTNRAVKGKTLKFSNTVYCENYDDNLKKIYFTIKTTNKMLDI